MLLILSDAGDNSTTQVIEWLEFCEKRYFRINTQDDIKLIFLGEDIEFSLGDKSFMLSDVKSFWYRRGFFTIKDVFETNIYSINKLLTEELSKIIEFIHYKLNLVKNLNSILNIDVNKLIVNDFARRLSIVTPTDLLFSNFYSLKILNKRIHNSFITKVISGNCMQIFDNFTIFNYTKELKNNNIALDDFFPSLVQNKIEKKYELRIFYLKGQFYSMAIFSQNDKQTNVDFRNYNDETPNRNVPYQLPREIEKKLDLLMKKLDLNCGSVDMIVTPANEYVFLEVNPVGQFGMVSFPCNYNLEKKIAQYLLNE